MKVFSDLKTRGCQDILIAVTNGLKGMSEALAAVFPATTLQTCIVHLIRHSLDFANWKERKPLVIYTTNALESVHAQLRKIIETVAIFPPTRRPRSRLSSRSATSPANRSGGAIHWRAAMTQCAILYEERFTSPNA